MTKLPKLRRCNTQCLFQLTEMAKKSILGHLHALAKWVCFGQKSIVSLLTILTKIGCAIKYYIYAEVHYFHTILAVFLNTTGED